MYWGLAGTLGTQGPEGSIGALGAPRGYSSHLGVSGGSEV